MEDLPQISLTWDELTAFGYFDIEDFVYTVEDESKSKVKEAKYWLLTLSIFSGTSPCQPCYFATLMKMVSLLSDWPVC